LRKAVETMSDYPPESITTDKLASYPKAIWRLQSEGLLSKEVEHRTSQYLNNFIEADHGALKRVIRPTRGFQSMKTARAAIKGFEVMRILVVAIAGHLGSERQAKSVSSISSSVSPPEESVRAGLSYPF
jgi:transposase-like protein